MKAAICEQTGNEHLSVADDVSTVAVGPGKVRIKMHAAGLCHSDLSGMNGTLRLPAPFVPGHEGSGEIVEVGAGVDLAVGQRVLICWMPACGTCAACRRGQSNLCPSGYGAVGVETFTRPAGGIYGFLGTGTFAEELVCEANVAVPIPDDVSYDVAALIGCGVTTGIGAALNSARLKPASSAVVVGLGGVGISAIQGAVVAGAAQIVAVDPVANRREWALEFGATSAISPEELPDLVASLPGGGFDYSFEAVGRPQTFRSAYEATRPGGTACLIGVGKREDVPLLSMAELVMSEKRVIPSFYGGQDTAKSFHEIIELYRTGRVHLEKMITHRVSLDNVNDALDQMRTGEALRTIIEIA